MHRLDNQGWSVGDLAYRTPVALVWLVFCQRGEERLVAKARGQAEAWRLAGEQAESLWMVGSTHLRVTCVQPGRK